MYSFLHHQDLIIYTAAVASPLLRRGLTPAAVASVLAAYSD